ncbi:kinase-like domain-containing protein, partial [Pelagophyceae sp. CCMP2097]
RCVAHDFFAEVAALQRLAARRKAVGGDNAATAILDFGVSRGTYVVVLERCLGTVAAWRALRGPLGAGDVALYVSIAARIARCVAEVAAAGVAHLDVKAENVLLRRDPEEDWADAGAVCLCDFGEARLFDDGGGAGPGAPLAARTLLRAHGTEAVQPPEVLRGASSAVGPPADVWALGCLAYEILAGRRLF